MKDFSILDTDENSVPSPKTNCHENILLTEGTGQEVTDMKNVRSLVINCIFKLDFRGFFCFSNLQCLQLIHSNLDRNDTNTIKHSRTESKFEKLSGGMY